MHQFLPQYENTIYQKSWGNTSKQQGYVDTVLRLRWPLQAGSNVTSLTWLFHNIKHSFCLKITSTTIKIMTTLPLPPTSKWNVRSSWMRLTKEYRWCLTFESLPTSAKYFRFKKTCPVLLGYGPTSGRCFCQWHIGKNRSKVHSHAVESVRLTSSTSTRNHFYPEISGTDRVSRKHPPTCCCTAGHSSCFQNSGSSWQELFSERGILETHIQPRQVWRLRWRQQQTLCWALSSVRHRFLQTNQSHYLHH